MSEKREFHPVLVPALDALIGNPDLLEPSKETKLKANEMYVPTQYIDRLNEFQQENSARREAANELLGITRHILGTIHYNNSDVFVCQNGMQIYFVSDRQLDFRYINGCSSSTSHALATAIYAQGKRGKKHVAILTGDSYIASRAFASDIDIAPINPDVYTGRRLLELPDRLYRSWFVDHFISYDDFMEAFPDENEPLLNEFVQFTVDPIIAASYGVYNMTDCAQFIGRFEERPNSNCELRRVHYINELPRYISPRSAGQVMLAEALTAPASDIPIVICPSVFGTGKTYLSTAIGLHFVTEKNPRYDRIFVVPRDAELGKEIGFLPGDEREKTLAKAMPIVDSVRAYVKNKGDRKKNGVDMTPQDISRLVDYLIDSHFELTSLIHMGGRSISDSWIIYDESQDMERFQINQLMKRIGDRSKMIIIGDPNQVFNRHMDYNSNGLMYAATKMAGSRYAAVVTMTEAEITRSEAAREIARRLDH